MRITFLPVTYDRKLAFGSVFRDDANFMAIQNAAAAAALMSSL